MCIWSICIKAYIFPNSAVFFYLSRKNSRPMSKKQFQDVSPPHDIRFGKTVLYLHFILYFCPTVLHLFSSRGVIILTITDIRVTCTNHLWMVNTYPILHFPFYLCIINSRDSTHIVIK